VLLCCCRQVKEILRILDCRHMLVLSYLTLLLLPLLPGQGDPVAVDRAPGGEAGDNRRKDQ
jgi:hypothetical protein